MALIPIISSLLYLAGGQWNKWYRWLLGLPIAAIMLLTHHSWISSFAILTYFIATNFFSYGEKMIWTKLFGPWGSMAISGFAFGLASYVCLTPVLGMIQTIIATIAFLVIKWLDDNGKIHNPVVELLRGLLGTIVFIGG